jgi:hypothetical protein
LDVLLRNGKLDVREALPIWSREVFGQIESQWGRMFRRFASIVVVGGGSILLRDELLKKFSGKALFPDEPVLSIAHGLYKFALTRRAKPVTNDASSSQASKSNAATPIATEAPAIAETPITTEPEQASLLPLDIIPIKPIVFNNALLA